MPRVFLVLLLAVAAFTARAEDKAKPSPAVKKILDKAVAEVKKNCQAFDKANARPLRDARLALEELSKQQTSDGKTKEAIATLQQAETLERDVMAMASGGKLTLSPAVKPILDQAVLGVMANRQALQNANESPLSEARSALEELAKKQTKDGKTKEAIATLQQVDTLERDVMAMAKAPVVVAKVPDRPWTPVGTYACTQSDGWRSIITIREDGTNICDDKLGKWERLGETKLRLTFYSGNWIEVEKGTEAGTLTAYKTWDGKTGTLRLMPVGSR